MQTDLPNFDPQDFLRTAPHKPGVYRMLGKDGTVLYVGKAKDLKNRLSSYFRGTLTNSRIFAMVKQICNVEIAITNTEAEALLLESNLIKQHSPRYNILLKDGKGYPYIHITAGEYPRIEFYRGSRKQPGQYFGPYPSVGAVRQTMHLMKKLFKARQCEDSYFANRSRPCLEYQIKRCSGPCVGMIDKHDYDQSIRHAVQFLQGRTQDVIDELVQKMESAAQMLNFEKAAEHRDLIESLRHISQQQYVSGSNGNVDVVSICLGSGVASVQVFTVRNGNNLGNRNFFPKLPDGDVASAEILSSFLAQYYLNHDVPGEILVSELPDDADVLADMLTLKQGRKVVIRQPQRGERSKWVELAQRNAEQALQMQVLSKAGMQQRLFALQEALGMSGLPARMECFDISHTMGEATVASCVVFDLNGPLKSEYRRYNIEGIQPGDDYAAMHQALTRRFRRAVEQAGKLPDILFIDGGKGQVSQALAVLHELNVTGVDVVGVAKGEGRKPGLETLIIEQGSERLALPEHSAALHLIQQIRDEAHRFAITGHRARRQKARTQSPLEQIEGLGAKRRQVLLQQFGGLKAIERASAEELAKVSGISPALARKIYDFFNGEES
ncbi:excinuclease ABC subunit UvrC [Thiothrix subterranea]|uniref:excinuclease ABC subunit UvrC n=1 Tax=Thiothrix subterranea TaxID=2735563 RepID=UPI00192CC893|nr:excinuclease ABC subunit UvrC [Thiothrix subterranea]QQZ27472.1 excinuclease ABC subunit UvrC [Thiothrix subterranea]